MVQLWHSPPLIDKFYPFKLACYQRALALHSKLSGKAAQLTVTLPGRIYMSTGDVHAYSGNESLSLTYYLQSLEAWKPTGSKDVFQLYTRLHETYYYRGNFDKALQYALQALKGAEAMGYRNLHQFYLYLGNDCFEMGQIAKSVEYYEQGIATSLRSDKILSGIMVKRFARSMAALGQSEKALKWVQDARHTFVSFTSVDSLLIEEALAICYNGLGKYDQAEQYYLNMANYIPRVPKLQAAVCPVVWSKFYYERGKHDKAITYIRQCLEMPSSYIPRFFVKDLYLMLYRIDSTRQQYQSALNYYLQYRIIDDSIYQSKQRQQIEGLRMQFDLEQKDRELQLRGSDIQLLTKEKLLQQTLADQTRKDAQLKQQSIDLLTQEASVQSLIADKQQLILQQQKKDLQLQQENIGLLEGRELLQASRLKQANFIKQLTIGGVVLLLIIIALLFGRYHTRKKTSQAISEKNHKLQQLVEEKEWLLKEVHHRVKNNLQVVLSLLQSQSAFLQDEALAAVHDSQHRIQAMSLIHQKLYQTDNVAAIDMATYIPELILYLQDSFNTPSHIRFVLDIEPVTLDVKQAIPLGLIINEAVTNTFKHAFPLRQPGIVSISLKSLNDHELALDVKDDGIGITQDQLEKRNGSLGMSLMKGLCSDFQARYTITSDQGTHLRVIFPGARNYTPTLSSHVKPHPAQR